MSRHRSFRQARGKGQKRSVLKRFERIDLLRSKGLWVDGENKRVTGLPKTKVS